MFIAMNRFKVISGSEEAFEKVWLERETYLDQVPGFVEFHLMRGPQTDDHTLYASHTVWSSQDTFEDWTHSEAFRLGHGTSSGSQPLTLGHPEFEGFEVLQTLGARKPVSAAAT